METNYEVEFEANNEVTYIPIGDRILTYGEIVSVGEENE